MGLAKRLLGMVEDGRITEDTAESVLASRDQLWQGQETSGQMLFDLRPAESVSSTLPAMFRKPNLFTGNAKPTLIDWSTDELKPREAGEGE